MVGWMLVDETCCSWDIVPAPRSFFLPAPRRIYYMLLEGYLPVPRGIYKLHIERCITCSTRDILPAPRGIYYLLLEGYITCFSWDILPATRGIYYLLLEGMNPAYIPLPSGSLFFEIMDFLEEFLFSILKPRGTKHRDVIFLRVVIYLV